MKPVNMNKDSITDKTQISQLKVLTGKKLLTQILICSGVLILVIFLCVSIGTQKISISKVFEGPGAGAGDNIDYEIFIFRLRRVITAALVGAALAAAGVILQALLRNPLADPYILGISSGAALGTIIAVISGLTITIWAGSPMALLAFVGAILTILLVWYIGRFAGKSQVTSLLLAGVVVNAFLSAVIMFLISIAKSEQLRTTVFWLMGNISEKAWSVIAVAAICIAGGITALFGISYRLNALTLGDSEAKNLGVDTATTRTVAFGFSAFITAVAVSLSGLIGFVGLIVPHGVRLVFGPDHRQLLPLSALIGSIFLIIADTIARTIFGAEQLPVGVITAIVGGPFFLILLARYSRKVGWLK